MNEEIIKKIAEEEFINNTMKHLDSALIFVYIKNLEKENVELNRMCEIYSQSLYNADLKKAEQEIERLNNIMNRIDNFVDRTIEAIKQQPTGDDEWILERLNGIKYLIELKDSDKE